MVATEINRQESHSTILSGDGSKDNPFVALASPHISSFADDVWKDGRPRLEEGKSVHLEWNNFLFAVSYDKSQEDVVKAIRVQFQGFAETQQISEGVVNLAVFSATSIQGNLIRNLTTERVLKMLGRRL